MRTRQHLLMMYVCQYFNGLMWHIPTLVVESINCIKTLFCCTLQFTSPCRRKLLLLVSCSNVKPSNHTSTQTVHRAWWGSQVNICYCISDKNNSTSKFRYRVQIRHKMLSEQIREASEQPNTLPNGPSSNAPPRKARVYFISHSGTTILGPFIPILYNGAPSSPILLSHWSVAGGSPMKRKQTRTHLER